MKLFSAKDTTKICHHASVFISREEEIAVIVTLHFNGKGGFLYEDNEPTILLAPLQPSILGQTLLATLKSTTIKELFLPGRRKLTDWPAFKASKVSSVRQFEQSFISILISGANDVNLIYVIDGEPYKDAELHVTSSVSSGASPEKIGKCLMTVFRAFRDRRI